MPTPTKGPRLGGGPAHERLILANLATSLFEHDSITTTEAKAKRLRPLAERLVTFAKRGDLHARRRVMTVVRDKGVVHRLFVEIAPDMAERHGGYTRITKIGARKGDNAPMAVIELVREPRRQEGHRQGGRGCDQARRQGRRQPRRRGRQEDAKAAAAETKASEEAAAEARRPRSSSPRVPSPRPRTARPPRATPSRATPTPGSTTSSTASGTTRRSPSSGSSPPRPPRPLASPRPAPDTCRTASKAAHPPGWAAFALPAAARLPAWTSRRPHPTCRRPRPRPRRRPCACASTSPTTAPTSRGGRPSPGGARSRPSCRRL